MEHRAPTSSAIKYGQANLDVSDEMNLQADRAKYERIDEGHPALGDARHR